MPYPRPVRGTVPAGLPRWARYEWLALVAVAAWSVMPLWLLSASGQGVFNGSEGLPVGDHLQYLAWIRDSGENVLFSNRFDVREDPYLFFHPMFALSGLAWSLGASLQVALLAWKPIAVVGLVAGFAAYVRRMLGMNPPAAAAALFLALFFSTPATPLAHWLGDDPALGFGTLIVSIETSPVGWLWSGYSIAISLALMAPFLLCVERLLAPSSAPHSPRWYAWAAGAAGLVVSWLHPWQGLTLLAMVGGLVVWDRFDRRYLVLAVPVALTLLPLAYYMALSHTDSSWAAAAAPKEGYAHWGWWLLAGLAPALLALPGLRGAELDIQERLMRLWPVAAIAVYFALDRSYFYHALIGLSLPLAILGVRGWCRLGVPRVASALVLLALTVPGLAWTAGTLESGAPAHFFTTDESAALAYLDRTPRRGSVLAALEPLGQAVPAFAGRRTWLGHRYWTPDAGNREAAARSLFAGELSPADARALVAGSGVTFLLSHCGSRTDLRPALGSLIARVRRFGCATVYELKTEGPQGSPEPAARTDPP